MKPAFDIEALVQPIPGSATAGVSLLHDPAFDAIKAARREDDPALPAGIWQTTLKVADWPAVEAGCRELLIRRSKDLTLAAWLGESWLHRYGCAALPACFELLSELCERYWDDIHPLPRDGDMGFRAAPLAWVAEQFPVLLRGRIGLCAGPEGSALTLTRWQVAQREAIALKDRKDIQAARREAAAREAQELAQAAHAAAPAELRDGLRAIAAARAPIAQLDAWCTPRLGAEAPGFGTLMETLDRLESVLREWLTGHPKQEEAVMVDSATVEEPAMIDRAPLEVTPPGDAAEPPAARKPNVPQSREEAYRLLAVVADYLMRYEPHSPVPYMLKRALDWGGKPLPELLAELMAGERGRALGMALGLLPESGPAQ